MSRRDRAIGGSFWPSDEQLSLLQACLLPAEPAREAWHRLRPKLDVDRLELGTAALLPLVYERLVALEIDEPLLARLKGVYRHVWYRNQTALTGLASGAGALRAAGVDSLTLSDGALVLHHYRRLGVRPLDVAQILVEPGRLPLAFDALAAAGWEGGGTRAGGRCLFEGPTSTQPLRCLLTDSLPEELEATDAAYFRDVAWQRRQSTELQGIATSVLDPTLELLCTLVTGARTGGSRVQWIADATTIVRSGPIDWTRLGDEAVRSRWILRVRDALAYLAEHLDVRAPSTLFERLDGAAVTRRERVAQWVGARGASFGMLAGAAANHLLETRNETVGRALWTFPSHLERHWGLSSRRALPGALARKSAAGIGRIGTTRRHNPARAVRRGRVGSRRPSDST